MTFRVVGYDDTTDINWITDTIWYDVTDYTYYWYTDWIIIWMIGFSPF